MSTTSVFLKPEFWVTLVTNVAGLLLAFGIITPAQSEGIVTHVPSIIGALLSLLSTFKFVTVQQAEKTEVFRALCATSLDKQGQVTAQGADLASERITRLARLAGL